MFNEHTPAPSQINLIIFGATGNLGQSLVKRGFELGYAVTAFVRNKSKLENQFDGKLPSTLNVIEGDILNIETVGQAIRGHGYLINTASNATEANFFQICQIVLSQAQKNIETPRRVWFMGGIAALDFGASRIMGVDCPAVPKMYQNHKRNYQALLETTNLDWSFMCPGPLVDSPNGKLTDHLRISVDEMPFQYPEWLVRLPKIALTLEIIKHVSETIVSYEDIANIMLTNLESNGRYSHKRVGIALPQGMKGTKKNWLSRRRHEN
ncbi:MAG: NAD(P)H-binding protein [Anaerolineales bacterium]